MKYSIRVLLVCFSFQLVVGQTNDKPNIIFIAIDDLKPTLGAYGDEIAITPNIDAIAKKGTIFLNNHTQQAICGPSRASIMTGKRPDFTQVWDLKTKMRDKNPDILTIPQFFKEHNYETIGLGKIYDPRCVDILKDKPSWSIPFINEREFKYPEGYKAPALGFYQNKDILKKIYALRNEAIQKGIYGNDINKYIRERYKPPYESSDAPDGAYVDGAIARKSIELLNDLDSSKPFFLAIGFKRPHLPFTAPQKYWDLYKETSLNKASYQRKSTNPVDIAYHNSGEMQSYKTPNITYELNQERLLKLDDALQKKLIHGYYAATSYIDAQIGKIMASLKEKEFANNTIIVIWGDHGWHLGDHSLWNKHSNFEQATRSPLIIYDPRVKLPFKVTSPTEFVDVFPTLCDMANLKIPEHLDGLSLNSHINTGQGISKPYAVSQYPRQNKMGYSFRTDQYRYTVWINDKKSTDPIYFEDIHAEELYDYRIDPEERNNKIDTKNYENLKNRFQILAAKFFSSQLKKESIISDLRDETQKPVNKYAKNRANVISNYIALKMNLNEANKQNINTILYEKYASNAEKTRGKNLSQDEKKIIYKAAFAETKAKLSNKFDSDKVSQIIKLERFKQQDLNKK